MTSHLTRAILRALLRTPGRILSVIALIAVAITVYAGTFIGLFHIENTTAALYRDLRLFDLELRVIPTALEGVPTALTLRARNPQLQAATWRLVVPARVDLSGPGERTAGAAVIAVSPETRPAVGDVLIVQGEYLAPGHPREVVIDKTFAEDHHLAVGDSLTLRVEEKSATVTVRGIGVLPEYLMSSVLPDYPVPIRGSLAAILLSQEQVAATLENPLVNSLVVTLLPGVKKEAVRDALTAQLAEAGVKVQARLWPEDQYSVHCTRVRLLSYRDFLPTLILVFNGLAFLVLLLTVRRMAQVWRKELGTLLAYGFHRSELLFAWSSALLLLVALGGIGGAVGALHLAKDVSRQFLLGTGFPILLPLRSLRPLFHAELLCFFIVFPAVLLPLLPLFLQPPAQLLRDEGLDAESSFVLKAIRVVGRHFDRLLWLHSPEKIGFRNVFRRPGVFVSSTLCVSGMLVAAASMYLFGAALPRGLNTYLSSQRWDYLIELQRPVSEAELHGLLGGTGATAWEGVSVVEGTVRAEKGSGQDRSYFLTAESLTSRLRIPGGLGIVRGTYLRQEGNREVVINLRLAQTLNVEVGDTLWVAAGASGTSARLRIVGITTNYAINQVFLSRQTLASLRSGPLLYQAAVLTVPEGKAGGLYVERRLRNSPQVARMVPFLAIKSASLKGCDALTTFVSLYGNLSMLVGVLLILVVIQVSVTDRAAEYALLRSLGWSAFELLRAILAEVFLLAVSAMLLSLPLTRLATWVFQQRLMKISDFVPIQASLSEQIKLLTPALFLMLLAAIPAALRTVRASPADLLRARIGG